MCEVREICGCSIVCSVEGIPGSVGSGEVASVCLLVVAKVWGDQ